MGRTHTNIDPSATWNWNERVYARLCVYVCEWVCCVKNVCRCVCIIHQKVNAKKGQREKSSNLKWKFRWHFSRDKNHKTKNVEKAAHNTKYFPALLCTVFLLCTFYIYLNTAPGFLFLHTHKSMCIYIHAYTHIYIHILRTFVCVCICVDIWYTLHALFNVSCFRFSHVVAVLLIATRVPFSLLCVCMFPHNFPNCILLYFCMLDIFVFVFSFISAN